MVNSVKKGDLNCQFFDKSRIRDNVDLTNRDLTDFNSTFLFQRTWHCHLASHFHFHVSKKDLPRPILSSGQKDSIAQAGEIVINIST